jgi:hypothetical protein
MTKLIRRAMRAATEAVIKLLGRADREGRRFFVVEGAAGGVVGAGFFERNVAVDQIDDVDPGQQILDKGIRDHFRIECLGSRIKRQFPENSALTVISWQVQP